MSEIETTFWFTPRGSKLHLSRAESRKTYCGKDTYWYGWERAAYGEVTRPPGDLCEMCQRRHVREGEGGGEEPKSEGLQDGSDTSDGRRSYVEEEELRNALAKCRSEVQKAFTSVYRLQDLLENSDSRDRGRRESGDDESTERSDEIAHLRDTLSAISSHLKSCQSIVE